MSFVHLNVTSNFSPGYGVNHPGELVEHAIAHRQPALALTDRDQMSGAVKHVAQCLKQGIDPILGVSLLVYRSSTCARPSAQHMGRVVILAKGHNRGAGYHGLCRLVSRAHENKIHHPEGLPWISDQDLVHLGRHTVTLLGPLSDIGMALGGRLHRRAARLLSNWQALGIDFRLELSCLLTTPGNPGSVSPNSRMLTLAKQHKVPIVLTNSVQYTGPEHAATADLLYAAKNLSGLSQTDSLAPNGQAWLKPLSGMEHVLRQILQSTDHRVHSTKILDETNRVAQLCTLDPCSDMGWRTPVMPEPQLLHLDSHADAQRALQQRTTTRLDAYIAGELGRAPQQSTRELQERLDQELAVIAQLGFASYFLTVTQVTQMIRTMGVRMQARGSAVSSLVNFLLGISNLNPLDHNLLFARFLSPQRPNLPDIDIDVEAHRRHDVYRKLFDKYGQTRVSLMSMMNQYRARGAIRDAGLALGVDPARVDSLAKKIWRFNARQLRENISKKPELYDMAEELENNQQLDLLVSVTGKLDRLPRHLSTHPCGVIISDASLALRSPLQSTNLGLTMSQYDKDDMDNMGFIKIDILGVRMQSAMTHACAEIERTLGTRIDLDQLKPDDQAVYDTLCSGHTLGVFQLESPGQQELVTRLRPRNFADIIAEISLFRPGPMQNNMSDLFLSVRHGKKEFDGIDPRVSDVLAPTGGVVLYHEQILELFDRVLDCGLGQADVYRRQLAKPEIVAELSQHFQHVGSQRGFSSEVLTKIWNVIAGFGSFGFARAHAAAFAFPTYQSAWLKVHYPAHFMAGLLTHDPGMWPKDMLVTEARRLGIQLLPIDIHLSGSHYEVSQTSDGRPALRTPLSDLSVLSQAEVDRILHTRPYLDIYDFMARARPRRQGLSALIKLGALDTFIGGDPRLRHQLWQQAQATIQKPIRHAPLPGQLTLDFQLPSTDTNPGLDPGQPLADAGQALADQIAMEQSILRMGISGHPFDTFRQKLSQRGVLTSAQVKTMAPRRRVRIAGLRRATNTPPLASGKRIVFVSLDDGTGINHVTFFPDVQEIVRDHALYPKYLVVEGTIRSHSPGSVSLIAEYTWEVAEFLDLAPKNIPKLGGPHTARDTSVHR